MLTAYRDPSINWCWWIIIEEKEGKNYLVGHFRERFDWKPTIQIGGNAGLIEDEERFAIGFRVSSTDFELENKVHVFDSSISECTLAGPRP